MLSVNPLMIFRTIITPSLGNKENFEIRRQPGDQPVQWMDYYFISFQAPSFCSRFVLVGFAAVLSLVWISGQRKLLCTRTRISFKAIALKAITDTLPKMYFVALQTDRRFLFLKVFGIFLMCMCVCVCMHLFVCVYVSCVCMWLFICANMMACIKCEGHII